MMSFSSGNFIVNKVNGKEVYFFDGQSTNIDTKTVESFGDEWETFDTFTDEEIDKAGGQYFDIVSDELLANKYVLDVGCGTGRWTKYVAKKARFVDAIDPSKAVFSAAKMLQNIPNTRISRASVDNIPFEDDSFDFVFCLGVLHHIPNTHKAMQSCVKKVKKGGWFLVYLYYNLDNRGRFYRMLFFISNMFRKQVSLLPPAAKNLVCLLLAYIVYLPFIYFSKALDWIGLKRLSNQIPLSYYKSHSWNIIKNDALDRFGTPLEQRFSRQEIESMMKSCGLVDIKFSNNEPFWHAIGRKDDRASPGTGRLPSS